MKKAIYLLMVLCAVILVPRSSLAEDPRDILIIVNNTAQSEKGVTISDVRAIFLKKRASLSSGGKVLPINAKEGTSIRKDFRKLVLGMNKAEEQKYWKDRRIKSGDREPVEFSNTQKAVFKLKGAVSYIYRKQYHKGVATILLVIPAK